jgi:hypothetical protein
MAGHLGLRHQNTGYHNPQISVHSACLEKNQDVTHAGGPTLSNKISESFGMCCQNDQKCRLPSTETEKIHLSTLNNSPQAQQQFFYLYSPLRWGHGGAHTDSAGGSFAQKNTWKQSTRPGFIPLKPQNPHSACRSSRLAIRPTCDRAWAGVEQKRLKIGS